MRVQPFKMRYRREIAITHRQHNFDQSGNPCAALQMPNICFYRTQHTRHVPVLSVVKTNRRQEVASLPSSTQMLDVAASKAHS